MTQTLNFNVPRPLTDVERENVEAYVASLVGGTPRPTAAPSKRLDVDALSSIFERLGSDKDGVTLAHEVNELRAAKYRE